MDYWKLVINKQAPPFVFILVKFSQIDDVQLYINIFDNPQVRTMKKTEQLERDRVEVVANIQITMNDFLRNRQILQYMHNVVRLI